MNRNEIFDFTDILLLVVGFIILTIGLINADIIGVVFGLWVLGTVTTYCYISYSLKIILKHLKKKK